MSDHLKYLSCFIFPVCVILFLVSGPHDITAALVWTVPLWSLVAADWLSPKVQENKQEHIVSSVFYDAILYLLTILHCVIIGLLLIYASQLQWDTVAQITSSMVNLVVLRILVGTTSGSSAIIVAHELIHRPQWHMQFLGRVLLITVCYEHFVIAHLREHHSTVATPADISTARLGESFNSYWRRVYIGHFSYAWNSEQERLGLTKRPLNYFKLCSNAVLQGMIIELAVVVLIVINFGWAAAFIFLYQAISAQRLLETINYYQHWGLEQGKDKNALAWVNQSSFTEYALVGLSNHISHHQNSALEFHKTPYSELGPVMPYGYFITNLWVKLNNDSYQRASAEILENYLKGEGEHQK